MKKLILIFAFLLVGCSTRITLPDGQILTATVPRGQAVEYSDAKYKIKIDNKPDAFWKTFLMTIGGNLPDVNKD